VTAALPCRPREQCGSGQKWRREIDGARENAHHERAQDLASIAHRAKPADRDALE